ncbi:MAG: hypothetical protein ACOCUW_01195 [Gemmatimonadota bacterium]
MDTLNTDTTQLPAADRHDVGALVERHGALELVQAVIDVITIPERAGLDPQRFILGSDHDRAAGYRVLRDELEAAMIAAESRGLEIGED